MTEMIERVAKAISGQDAAGWLALPENDRERLYGGGKWHDEGRTRDDYRWAARAAIEAMRGPTTEMLISGRDAYLRTRRGGVCGMTIDAQIRNESIRELAAYQAMIDAALTVEHLEG